jgi:hypothetical protein
MFSSSLMFYYAYRQPQWSNSWCSIAGLASWRIGRLFLTGPISLPICRSVCHKFTGRLLGHFWSHIKYVYIFGKIWLSAKQRCKFRVSTVQHWLMQLTFVYNESGWYFKKDQSDVFEFPILWNLDSSRTKLSMGVSSKYDCLRHFFLTWNVVNL